MLFLFFFFCTVYMYDMSGYMYAHTYMLVCVCAHACVGKRLTLGIFADRSPPYALNRVSHLSSEIPGLVSLASHLASSIYCL